MSLRQVVRLSSSVPILLLGALPLPAQTALNHFAGSPNSMGWVWPEIGSHAEAADEPSEDDGSASLCASLISLHCERPCPQVEGGSFSTSSEQQTSSARPQRAMPETNTDPPSENVHSSTAA